MDSTRVAGRTLSCVADVLAILADGCGGLRSGPAANREWQRGLRLLEEGDTVGGVKEMARVRSLWMDTPSRQIRAARHYEAAAQIFTRKTVMSVEQFINLKRGDQNDNEIGIWHYAKGAARIDVAGGWSDTPPITYEYGGAVLNIAIRVDGKKPIGARCRRIADPVVRVRLESDWEESMDFCNLEQIECYRNPSAPGALACAVLICSGLVDVKLRDIDLKQQLVNRLGTEYCGIEIESWSNLPRGSGLGSSSILAGCLLAVLWSAIGMEFDNSTILHAVLYVEQLLTTGGGWQDQVGGLTPGLKIGRFGDTPETAKITVESIPLPEEQLQMLQSKLLLVYTGRTRLAKNLLQEVIRNWYSRKRDIVDTVARLVQNAEKCAKAAKKFDWEAFAKYARVYWEQKQFMAPGSEPTEVGRLLTALYAKNIIKAGWLAGAGGGGFLYLFLESDKSRLDVESLLSSEDYSTMGMTVHSVDVDLEPLECFTSEN